jgi:NAD(P) transhydrogenase
MILLSTQSPITLAPYLPFQFLSPGQSSSLYSNNISKLLLSAGPFTGGPKDAFRIDHADPVIR